MDFGAGKLFREWLNYKNGDNERSCAEDDEDDGDESDDAGRGPKGKEPEKALKFNGIFVYLAGESNQNQKWLKADTESNVIYYFKGVYYSY